MQKQVISTFTAAVCHRYIITRGVAFLQKNPSEAESCPHPYAVMPPCHLSLSVWLCTGRPLSLIASKQVDTPARWLTIAKLQKLACVRAACWGDDVYVCVKVCVLKEGVQRLLGMTAVP